MSTNYSAAISGAADLLTAALTEHITDVLITSASLFDGDVRALMRQVGREVTQRFAVRLADAIVARAKAHGFSTERVEEIVFGTLFGDVSVPSPYMIHSDGSTDRPVNRVLHVHGRGRTPLVERALTDFGMDDSFQKASTKFLEHYGIEVGRTSILRIVERQGERAIGYVTEQLDAARTASELDPPAEPVATMIAELDGCELRTGALVPAEGAGTTPKRHLPKRRRITAWRDVRVGLVRPLESDEPSYVASLGSFDEMVRDLEALARLRGAGASTQHVKVVDGGNGLREALDRRLAGPTILDLPHFRSQLFETADAMGLATSVRATTVARWTATASRGEVSAVIAELQAWRPPGWTADDEAALPHDRDESTKLAHPGMDRARRLANHLRRFEDAVAYDAFEAAGYPLGDGEVESAHRVIPQARCKKPGAWWLPENIDRILALRVVRANGWWSGFWAERDHPARMAA